MLNKNILFVVILIIVTQGAIAQIKKDSIYYILDSKNKPKEETPFEKQVEGNFLTYVLKCKCYPHDKDPVFVSRIENSQNTQFISIDEFEKIKTISISKLIKLTKQYGKDKVNRYSFFFIEQDGIRIKKTKVVLMPPRNAAQDAVLY